MKYQVEILIRNDKGEVEDSLIVKQTDSLTEARNRMYLLDGHSDELDEREIEHDEDDDKP